MPKIKRSPQAKQDLREHVLYLAKINPHLAERFIDASAATFAQLAVMPKMGMLQEFKPPELAGTRRWFVAGFEYYLIFYRRRFLKIACVTETRKLRLSGALAKTRLPDLMVLSEARTCGGHWAQEKRDCDRL